MRAVMEAWAPAVFFGVLQRQVAQWGRGCWSWVENLSAGNPAPHDRLNMISPRESRCSKHQETI